MKLNGRRMSDNINDRRGEGLPGGGGNGMGLLGLVGLLGGGRKRLLIVAAVIVFALVTQGTRGSHADAGSDRRTAATHGIQGYG